MLSPSSPIDQANAALQRGDTARAIAVIQQAADRGDPDALFQAALWRLIGRPLARDLPRARMLLRRAADAGSSDAAMIEIALTANGSGGTKDWPTALRLLRQAASTNPAAAAQLATLDAMAIDTAGNPSTLPRPQMLSVDPAVSRFPALLTPDECRYLIAAVDDILAPATVVDPATGRMISNPIRTSDGAVIGPTRENLVVRAINRRIAAISGTPFDNGEPLSVLRYRPGQQYRLHSDALPGNANQRVATVLVYLNDDFSGGETDFPAIGVTVKPAIGDAVLFRNITGSGAADQRMVHAGLPVTKGVKWLATRWIRAARFDPWTAR